MTRLTSNPTIFDHAIKNGDFYDDAIRQKAEEGKSGETSFFEPALEDLTQAADLFSGREKGHYANGPKRFRTRAGAHAVRNR